MKIYEGKAQKPSRIVLFRNVLSIIGISWFYKFRCAADNCPESALKLAFTTSHTLYKTNLPKDKLTKKEKELG